MTKLKSKNKSAKKQKKKTDIKDYALNKIESLSWQMGKKNYSSRNDIYDR